MRALLLSHQHNNNSVLNVDCVIYDGFIESFCVCLWHFVFVCRQPGKMHVQIKFNLRIIISTIDLFLFVFGLFCLYFNLLCAVWKKKQRLVHNQHIFNNLFHIWIVKQTQKHSALKLMIFKFFGIFAVFQIHISAMWLAGFTVINQIFDIKKKSLSMEKCL